MVFSQPDSCTNTAEEQAIAALQNEVAVLEYRAGQVSDANEIKRLQRSFGYYFDKALWDDVADLFAENGTIEIGLDGVYQGQDHVREYLYALGGGRAGLAEGQLNETMQLMPVITVDPSGATAKGRWRAILMRGKLGQSAFWGEGQYENEYVKVGGTWRIKALHWYQDFVVPYQGGWLSNADANNCIWASNVMQPDAPTTVPYQPWPNTMLPPFHFTNPVAGVKAVDYNAIVPPETKKTTLPALAKRTAALEHKTGLIQDELAVEKLQRIFGFYVDKGFWSEAADLFAESGTIEQGASGVFVGKARVLEYLRSLSAELPLANRLYDEMQLQPVVHVAPDGKTAKGRWHLFAQEAMWGEYGNWRVGVYENDYVKENDRWKIQNIHLYTTVITPYLDGWGVTALPESTPPVTSLAPDLPQTVAYSPYPGVFTPPFHYENPVTGRHHQWEHSSNFDPAPTRNIEELTDRIAALAKAVERVEDVNGIERLQGIYGYYLATDSWDDFANIFAPNGTIEIAMRGLYIGRPSVRRHVDLYGPAGMQYGFVHNHMQFQPVIDIADDGLTAKLRSRAFSQIGTYKTVAMWMGGIYENSYVKIDGVWQIQSDNQINTYFAQYAVGWKSMVPRSPPGISTTIPPDAPPTRTFKLYPAADLPPFHYTNPITGHTVTWP